MPSWAIINSLRHKFRHSISSKYLEDSFDFDLREGEEIIITYNLRMDKMKFFSAFVGAGLENGDAVFYTYPDEEGRTVRTKLREYGVDVKKYEKSGALSLETLTECFMSNGELDFSKSVSNSLNWWAWAKRKGYKHARGIEDLGDLSFFGEQWSKYVTEYWQNPEWDDPDISDWVKSEELLGIVYDPFLKEVTAINVEHMSERQIAELLRTLNGKNVPSEHSWINLVEYINVFSKRIGLSHKELIGRKCLLEFDSSSDYEKVVYSLAKESMANVAPILVFTPGVSSVHNYLAKEQSIKFFLTSISTSTPKKTSKNTMVLPAKNTPLILDAISKVLKTYKNTDVCLIFDILSDLLLSIGPEKTLTFLHIALDLLSSEKVTSLFLLNTGAHEPEVVSRLRNLFSNQLTYNKNGLEVVKIF